MDTIELGDTVKDITTGFKGVVMARSQWLYGCDRLTIQAKVTSDGRIPDMQSFDIGALVLVKKAKKTPKSTKKKKGGPAPLLTPRSHI